VHFDFPDAPRRVRRWWLIISKEGAAVCDIDPGYEVAVSVTASLRRMVEVWRGDVRWSDAVGRGILEVDGPEAKRRALPGWFTLPVFASVPRPS